MYKYVTIVGSRSTHESVIPLIHKIAEKLIPSGYILRSGAAAGMDTFAENAFLQAGGTAEIYLPWKGFNGHDSPNYDISYDALDLARRIHPNWAACSQAAAKLHARNCYQVLGKDLKTPSRLIIFWAQEINGKIQGGTATAVNLGKLRNIPVYNLLNVSEYSLLKELDKFI